MGSGRAKPISLSVKKYTKKYKSIVRELHITNGITDLAFLDNYHLPRHGIIVSIGDIPVAIGFLRMVEGGFAQFDSFVTNGYESSENRHLALSALIVHLTQKARLLGLKAIIAHTSDNGLLSRAEAIGFKVIPQTIIGLSL